MVKEISLEEAKKIVRDRMPFGLFIVKRSNGGVYALENSQGDAQLEPFRTQTAAKHWLEK